MTKRVHLNPLQANDTRYAYVLFAVPASASRISIACEYDKKNDANTLDIGLFDARSTSNDDPRGFRGWSGGRRAAITVAPGDATPGYAPGPLYAGEWRVIFGLYRIAPEGIDVNITVNIEKDSNEKQNPAAAPRATNILPSGATPTAAFVDATKHQQTLLPSSANANSADTNVANANSAPRWFRGDLHMHTTHSDGDWTVEELVAAARHAKLDFISITDHNTMSHHAFIDRLSRETPNLLVLRGEEVTTYGGHANAWGLPSGAWIDFRVRPNDDARMSCVASDAHQAGALISINHPFALCKGCAWSYDRTARDFDGIEVWNGAWDITDEQALVMWDKILQTGRHLTAIGSSDSHRPANALGVPTTHVATRSLLPRALLDAIHDGRVYVTREAASPTITFEAEAKATPGVRQSISDEISLSAPAIVRFFITIQDAPLDATLTLISNSQIVRHAALDESAAPISFELECRANSYFRIEVRNRAGAMLALTNPIYVKLNSSRAFASTS